MDKSLYIPIYASLGFIVFTEIFFLLGPINYYVDNPLTLFLFLFFVNLSLFLGYIVEIRRSKLFNRITFQYWDKVKLVKVLMLISLLIKPLSFYFGWQLSSFAPSAYISKFMLGITAPNEAYEDFNDFQSNGILGSFLVLLGPISMIAQPLGIYFIEKFPKKWKFLAIVLVVLDIVYTLGLGNRKRMLDVIIIVFFSYLASKGHNAIHLLKNRKFIAFISFLIFGLFVYFLISSLSRAGTDSFENFYTMFDDIKPWYEKNVPVEIYMALANIQMYLCHAYVNLSYALDHFFSLSDTYVFSWGIGNNVFTINMFKNFFGIDVLPYTYQHLLTEEYHRPIGLVWMTIYPWLANDVTFLGVPIVFYFLGRIMGRLWYDSLYARNIFAVPLLCLVLITVFYSFANNQALSYSFLSVMVISWLYVIENRNIKN